MKSNVQFGSYLDYYKRLRGIIKPKSTQVVEPVGLYGYDRKKTMMGLGENKSPGSKSLRNGDSPKASHKHENRART
jgi:hypothetical protein